MLYGYEYRDNIQEWSCVLILLYQLYKPFIIACIRKAEMQYSISDYTLVVVFEISVSVVSTMIYRQCGDDFTVR
ncbi:MAG: hypothetical protein NZ519_05765 [Bacteroidia bacterium]|nr:hypothetical protein [Bacteroidia bacterium]